MRTASSSYIGNDFNGISAYTESSAFESHIVSLILNIDELYAVESVPFNFIADLEANHSIDVLLRSAKSIDTRDCGNNDDVATEFRRELVAE
jgi:hypothetical protein